MELTSEIKGKIRVGIIGPYTRPDPAENTHLAVIWGIALREMGFAVFIPHLFHLAHLIQPMPYEFWAAWDYTEYQFCDCFYRLPGESAGADEEEVWAGTIGRPVFRRVEELIVWANRKAKEEGWK